MIYDRVTLVVRLSKAPAILKYYGDIFRTRNYGAERAAEIYPVLREEALSSLKGVFAFEELKLLMEIMNSVTDRFELSQDIFIQKIKEMMKFHTFLSAEEKGMVQGIIDKIEKMSFYEAIVLSEWICSYHSFSERYKGQKKHKKRFKNYAQQLI